MNSMKIYSKKIVLSCLIFAGLSISLAGAFYYQPQMFSNTPFLKDLLAKFTQYQEVTQEDKVYLQFDKKMYEPSEDIWFSAYVRNAQTFQKSDKSGVVYVNLLNPKGSTVQELTLLTENGKAAGVFKLDENIKGGQYTIKAYTKWQENTNTFFEQTITVQKSVLPNLNMKLNFDRKAYGAGSEVVAILDLNTLTKQPLAQQVFTAVVSLDGGEVKRFDAKTNAEGRAKVVFNLPQKLTTNDGLLNIMIQYQGQTESISRSVPITLGNIDLEFYPEGGELVEGMICGVGFKALDEFGKPADIEGKIYDQNDRVVATLESYHQGMGKFELAPQRGAKYFAKITAPSSAANKIYELPTTLAKGYALKLQQQRKNSLDIAVLSSQNETLYLVAQSRSKMIFSKDIEAQEGLNTVHIPTHDFPIGITQITLFDSKQVARAERLVFVNADKQLDIAVKTDKEKYLPREKVNVELVVTDERGIPVAADLSLAVVDDKLLTFADDKQGHILSYMLLQSDLKGDIEEPNFYFDKANDPTRLKPEINRQIALDNLMMTQGWRKFEWQQIIDENYKLAGTANEPQLIAGKLMDEQGNPMQGIGVALKGTDYKVLSRKDGTFSFKEVLLYKPTSLQIDAKGYYIPTVAINDYNSNLNITLSKGVKITGKITDETGEAMPFATVRLNGNQPVSTETDLDGNYEISTAAVNNSTMLTVSYVGYSSKNIQLANPIQSGTLNIEMDGGVEMLEDMVVINDRRPVRSRVKKAEGGRRRNVMAPEIEEELMEVDIALDDIPEPVAPVVELMEVEAVDIEKEEMVIMKEMDISAISSSVAGIAVAAEEEVLEDANFGANLFDEKDRAEGKKRMKVKQEVFKKVVTTTRYQQVRVFAEINYEDTPTPELRTDFRNTIYWNPSIKTDKNGKAKFSFYNSDAVTQFRITAEGFGQSGSIGRVEYKYFAQLPFQMTIKVPSRVLSGDELRLPLVLTNNTDSELEGILTLNAPESIVLAQDAKSTIRLKANESKTIFVKGTVGNLAGVGNFMIAYNAKGLQDKFVTPILVSPRGFPVRRVYAGSSMNNAFELTLQEAIAGSVVAKIQLYPSVLDEVMSGMAAMLRMPSGCFEQTSSANYPNLLALDYLRETGTTDIEVETRAKQYLEVGYGRLVGYESKGGGFDWWGRNPAHEALSAYGLMQFVDMKSVYSVDPQIIERCAKWLLSRKDGKGSWTKNPNALHSWAAADVTDAYIVWAMCEAGYSNQIAKEIEHSYQYALQSKDPYSMALMANALYKAKDKRAATLVEKLVKMQQKNGSFAGLTSSVTNSTGISLQVETTSLVALALMQHGGYTSQVQKAISSLSEGKSYNGYGSTQGTVLALKALLEYAKTSKQSAEDGELVVFVNEKRVTSLKYKAGQKELILPNIAAYLKEGKQKVRLEYQNTKTALPFDVELSYNTRLPQNSAKCPFDLQTKMPSTKIKMGETIRLTTTLTNKLKEGQPMTMAMVGIPAGLSLQPWQLKELQEKKVFDYYELFEGYVVFHYEQMKASEVKVIHLDLKADIPGDYEAPASTAFLYYTNEHKVWTMPERMTVMN